jgi:hypothetical protein
MSEIASAFTLTATLISWTAILAARIKGKPTYKQIGIIVAKLLVLSCIGMWAYLFYEISQLAKMR